MNEMTDTVTLSQYESTLIAFFEVVLEEQIEDDVLSEDISLAESIRRTFNRTYIREMTRDHLLDDVTVIGSNGDMSPFGMLLDNADEDLKTRLVDSALDNINFGLVVDTLREDYINRNLTFKKEGYNN